MRVFAAALLIAVVGLLAGCGSDPRDDGARAVVERFQTALDSRDGAAACAELSEQTTQALEQQEQRPCGERILDIELPRGTRVSDTDVESTSASVSLVEGGTLFLSEAADGWEISAAGCEPAGSDLPFECELED